MLRLLVTVFLFVKILKNMKKVLFIDRDWTLILEPPITFQVDKLEEIIFLPKVITSLSKFINLWYELVIVTNQDWLGTSSNPRYRYNKINKKIFEIFSWEWVTFSEIFECEHFPEDNCNCRKPKAWILKNYLRDNDIDFKSSYMIWDRESDKEFASNIWVQFKKVIFWDKIYNWDRIVNNLIK